MKLICMGDSTMQYNDASTFPQIGWPQALESKLKKEVELLNFAKNGRSTKTFIEYGHFAEAIKEVDNNTIVLIEFGHNDGHTQDLERFTRPDYEYRDNLIYMVNECRKKGSYVVLLTPIYRRWFKEDGTLDMSCHSGYREAMIKVGKDTNTPVIDMTLLTREKLIELGPDASKELYMNFPANIYENYPQGMSDDTHLRLKGAIIIRDIFLNAVKDDDKFKEYLYV